MIVLSATTDELRVVLAAAVTTKELQCVASWRDIASTPTYSAGRTLSNTTGTTEKIIVDGPASGRQRVCDFISIYNADSASATVTLIFDDGASSFIIDKKTLAAGARMEYENGKGIT